MEVDRIICPTASFDRLFNQPLAALRQAAAAYPSISIRIVERLGVAAASVGDAGFTAHLRSYAREVVEHASQLMAIDKDRGDLGAAFERAFPDPSAELRAVP